MPAVAVALLLVACGDASSPVATGPSPSRGQVSLGSRSGKVAAFPCSQCHAQVDPAVVAGGQTKKHAVALAHGPLACTTCHEPGDMDRLRLAAGGTTSFDTVHALCGQCHVEKARAWAFGAHGKSIGGWSGPRQRFVCTDCHSPHAPALPMVVAKPAPVPPRRRPQRRAPMTRPTEPDRDRRGFLKLLGLGTAAAAASTTTACSTDWDRFFQKHYKEMTPVDKALVFARLEAEGKARAGRPVKIGDPPPVEGAAFAFAISLSLCNGNRACVYACVEENNQGRDPAIQYIKVVELDRGTLDPEKGDLYYEGEVPKPGKVYLPMQCNQCDDPPCVKVCPVEATWKERDGIVVIDYDWCIGCRYCMAACPYEARRFNFTEPKIPAREINPHQGYLSNRPRPRGVVEKCHFCLHRTRLGNNPACMEACTTGARKFGDLNDPTSEVAQILKEKRVFVLREELATHPRVFYYFD
ncbi:MAG: 4Fe-4S dicluster domain-containing protein [bacterium]